MTLYEIKESCVIGDPGDEEPIWETFNQKICQKFLV